MMNQKYMLYGIKMIEDDSSLHSFAKSIMKTLATDYQISRAECEDDDEYKDKMLDAAYERIHDELSMTAINYGELLERFAKDVGQLLYDMENHGFDLSVLRLSFFDNTGENFNALLHNYISIHFEELEGADKPVEKAKFKVEIPGGYLMVEEKGVKDEYPGVFISFSEDGKEYDVNNIVACVEYDTCAEEVKTETYQEDCEEPNNIVCWKDGRNMI